MTLKDMKEALAKVEAKITSIYDTGQEYTIVGSHTVKNPDLEQLETQAARLRRRIFRYQGKNVSRTAPDFS